MNRDSTFLSANDAGQFLIADRDACLPAFDAMTCYNMRDNVRTHHQTLEAWRAEANAWSLASSPEMTRQEFFDHFKAHSLLRDRKIAFSFEGQPLVPAEEMLNKIPMVHGPMREWYMALMRQVHSYNIEWTVELMPKDS